MVVKSKAPVTIINLTTGPDVSIIGPVVSIIGPDVSIIGPDVSIIVRQIYITANSVKWSLR